MAAEFNEVFHRELKDVTARKIPAGGKRQDGLPRLPQFKNDQSTIDTAAGSENQDPSPGPEDLNKALAEIYCDTQDDNWREWVEKAKEEEDRARHPGLVGLALSGGGIRSATFNLGIIQALKKFGVFDKIHYLSTVSGGGYIGCCLSSLAADREIKNSEFQSAHGENAFEHDQGVEEPLPVRHLRNNANYLTPKGIVDVLRIPAMVFRGILINLLIVFPYILLAAVITLIIKPSQGSLTTHSLLNVFPLLGVFGENFLVTKLLAVLVVISFAAYPPALMIVRKFDYFGSSAWQARDRTGNAYGFAMALIGLAAFVEFQPFAIDFFVGGQFNRIASWFQDFLTDGQLTSTDGQDTLTAVGAIAVALAPYFLGKNSGGSPGRARSFGIYFVGVFSFLVFWLVYLSLCRWALIQDTAADWMVFDSTLYKFYYQIYLLILEVSPDEMYIFTVNAVTIYIVVGVILWIYSVLFVDVNFISLHNFYRDRLSKAFLISWNGTEQEEGYIIQNDEQRLSKLDIEHAPYHLINAALNVKHRKEAYQKGRKADFFIFSKNFIGGELTGYCKTTVMEKAQRQVNLGTAMAISGAAASPNMGKATVKPLVFVMAMLNIRLNYWLPNPGKFKDWPRWAPRNPMTRAGPFYLILEMFGWLNEHSWNVNLTDGGHIENLGAFELLRRECRLIIVGDGECDPDLKFEAIAELTRLAQIDLSIKIEFDGLDCIRNGEQHHAIGTIHYANGRIGKLIYLKSSLRGDNALESTLQNKFYESSLRRNDDRLFDTNAYIAHYRAENPAFPHEKTADQFFDETQFECYRALGFQVADSVFGD